MQRLLTLRVGTSRLNRAVNLCQLNSNKLTFKRYATNGQPKETIDPLPKNTVKLTGSENVRSVYGALASATETKNDTNTSNKTSASQDGPFQSESDLRDNVLRESLKFVEELGWTIDAIRAGIRTSNQSSTIEGLFSSGYDLVDYFQRDANSKMSAYMKEQVKKGEIQGTRLLIDSLKYRLGLVIPYASTWGQAMAQGALPQNSMRSWKSILELSSDAWHGIGDTSTDINWYTKRLVVATVYKSAEVYMLQDQSQEKLDTMDFLERRLNDFQTLGSLRNTMSKSLSDTAQITSGIFSVIRNLTSRR
ncbi:unnamed protein product [Rotaria magnacalcarata]|uniref:Ubiquinone biosynthesis protein n=1 Tax=Rotaria magnacalcarata TaxID=392030 RepID=A0A816T5C9_9BILA|nr:unnamed protein product [Rotaria magnacalcarata]CAF4034487.1 unnamed protein product [Rotaria magnacalcarata]